MAQRDPKTGHMGEHWNAVHRHTRSTTPDPSGDATLVTGRLKPYSPTVSLDEVADTLQTIIRRLDAAEIVGAWNAADDLLTRIKERQ
jgi:hypothetical protein